MGTNFIRWSDIAGVLGRLLAIVGSFLAVPFRGQYLLSGLLLIVALIGILLTLQREGAGRWGLFGILAALTGILFFGIGQFTALAGLSFGLGLILLAIGLWKSSMFPRWLPAPGILAPVVGLPRSVLVEAADYLTMLATILYGLAFIGAGYALWTVASPSAAQPSSGRGWQPNAGCRSRARMLSCPGKAIVSYKAGIKAMKGLKWLGVILASLLGLILFAAFGNAG